MISSCLRLYSNRQITHCHKSSINYIIFSHSVFHRKFSDDLSVKSQSGIFQSISESVPVEYIQKFLVAVHDCGLPWWATIITTTITCRSCITVPLAIYQQSIIAKLENIKLEMPPIVKELQKETAIAAKLYNWNNKTAQYHYKRSLKKQWNRLIIRDNCHPFKASLLLWFQVPLWICYSMSLRNLIYLLPRDDLTAHIIYTQLSLGGFGWIINLTEVDSTFILPFLLGLLNLINIELNTLLKTSSSKFQNYVTYFFRGISVLMIPIAASVPSCLALYWTISSGYGLIQNLILMSPRVKRFCRIPQTPNEIQNPYKHVINNIKQKYMLLKNKLI